MASTAMRSRTPTSSHYADVSFDVLGNLLSFYMRSSGIALNQDYDREISRVQLAHGTGKVSVLLMVHANPGIRPSVIAHFIRKDRSAMARLIEQMKRNGLLKHEIDADERRAHELYLTSKGEALVDRVRRIAVDQSDRFFGVLDERDRADLLRILMRLYEHHVAALPRTITNAMAG